MDFIAKLEQRVQKQVDADFKKNLKKAMISVFILLNPACGAQERKQPTHDQTQNPDSGTTDNSSSDKGGGSDGGGGSSGGDTYVPPPSPSTQREIRKTLDQQLLDRGWGCQVGLHTPTKLVWRFQLAQGTKATQEFFTMTFTRQDDSSPWDMTKPTVDDKDINTDEGRNLMSDVLDSVKYGAKYIYDHYTCDHVQTITRTLPF